MAALSHHETDERRNGDSVPDKATRWRICPREGRTRRLCLGWCGRGHMATRKLSVPPRNGVERQFCKNVGEDAVFTNAATVLFQPKKKKNLSWMGSGSSAVRIIYLSRKRSLCYWPNSAYTRSVLPKSAPQYRWFPFGFLFCSFAFLGSPIAFKHVRARATYAAAKG